MSSDIWLILFGIFVGMFGTLIGAGGGFILTPVLLLLYPHDNPETLTCISLAVTCANALSGSAAYAKMKRINYKYGLIFSGASIPGAILGAMSTYYVARRTFDLIFAILLIISSVFIFMKKLPEDNITDGHYIHLSKNKLLIGITISAVIGFVSSFLGLGGGIIHVPVLSELLGFPVHIATATSHFVVVIVTFIGTLVHIFTGTAHPGLHRCIDLGLGVLMGAQIGAKLSVKIKSLFIMRSLSVALFIVGIRLIIFFFMEY
jgi:uncharacterized protein